MEERAYHAAELEAASRQLEELREMAARLGQVVQQARMAPSETKEETLGRNPKLSHALDYVLDSWPPEVAFTATGIAAEVERRYGAVLCRDVNPRPSPPRGRSPPGNPRRAASPGGAL